MPRMALLFLFLFFTGCISLFDKKAKAPLEEVLLKQYIMKSKHVPTQVVETQVKISMTGKFLHDENSVQKVIPKEEIFICYPPGVQAEIEAHITFLSDLYYR